MIFDDVRDAGDALRIAKGALQLSINHGGHRGLALLVSRPDLHVDRDHASGQACGRRAQSTL
jgi:hypothetical protein